MEHPNHKKVFNLTDGSFSFIYSSDNLEWVSLDAQCIIDDNNGIPTWPDSGPANGSFSNEGWHSKRALMMAANSMELLVEEGCFTFSLANERDDQENYFSLANMFADSFREGSEISEADAVLELINHLQSLELEED